MPWILKRMPIAPLSAYTALPDGPAVRYDLLLGAKSVLDSTHSYLITTTTGASEMVAFASYQTCTPNVRSMSQINWPSEFSMVKESSRDTAY